MAGPESAAESAGVEGARQRWAAAFNAGDMAGLLALYHPQAVLWGTTSAVLLHTTEGITAYFQRTFSTRPAPQVQMGEARTRVLGDVALCSGAYTLQLSGPQGEARTLAARFSFAYRRVNGQWLIVDHHSSVSP